MSPNLYTPNKIWLDLNHLIADQLNLQVRIQFDHHHQFLKDHDLDLCKHVVDLGTGNGAFLHRLAMVHPNIEFVGIDDKAHMIEQAHKHGTTNVLWKVGDATDGCAADIAKADGVLMRYFLLHLEEASAFLSDLAATLKKGARIWIVDLDHERSVSDPSHSAFDKIKDLVARFCDAHGRDCNLGSKLPGLLKDAGFASIQQRWESLNTRETDIDLFQKFLLQEVILYRSFLKNGLSDSDFDDIKRFIDELPISQIFVNYGVTMISALK